VFIVFCDLMPFVMSQKYYLRSVDGSKQIISDFLYSVAKLQIVTALSCLSFSPELPLNRFS